ncbi:MAG: hypothetical protein ACHQ9S_15960 [Candidatus Binatia bacterium]
MRVSKVITLIAPLTVALIMAPGAARAEHGGGLCRQEFQNLCGNTPGSGGFFACLAAYDVATNSQGLTAPCLTRLSHIQTNIAVWKTCEADPTVQTACGQDVGPGHHKDFIRCLRQLDKSGGLPTSCQPLLAQHHGHHPHHHHCHPTPTPGQ